MFIHIFRAVLLSVSLLGFTSHSFAQDARNGKIIWEVSGLQDPTSNVQVPYRCVFETSPSTIRWSQSHDFQTMIRVVSVSGTWNDVKQPGTIQFSISLDQETGTIEVERTAQGVFITLDISQTAGQRLRQKFTVSKVTEAN